MWLIPLGKKLKIKNTDLLVYQKMIKSWDLYIIDNNVNKINISWLHLWKG